MAKLPAIQFYPGDWKRDVGVQSLNFHDRGVWFEMLLLMHESPVRGKLMIGFKAMPVPVLAKLLQIPVSELEITIETLLEHGVTEREKRTGALVNRRMLRDENDRAESRRRMESWRKSKKVKRNGNADVTPQGVDPETEMLRLSSSSSSSSSSASASREEIPIAPSPTGIAAVASPVFLSVTLNDKSQHPVTEADVSEWQALFPAIDVRQEIREVKAWSDANPQRRKTKAGVRRFIVAWLGRAQDKGGSGMGHGTHQGSSNSGAASPAAARVESGANAFRQAGLALGLTGTGGTHGANGSALPAPGHRASSHELPVRHATADGKAWAAAGEDGAAHVAHPPRPEVLSPPHGSGRGA